MIALFAEVAEVEGDVVEAVGEGAGPKHQRRRTNTQNQQLLADEVQQDGESTRR